MVYVEKTSNKRHMQEPDLAINRTQTGQLFLCSNYDMIRTVCHKVETLVEKFAFNPRVVQAL